MSSNILNIAILLLISGSLLAQTKTAVTSKEANILTEITLSTADIEVFKE